MYYIIYTPLCYALHYCLGRVDIYFNMIWFICRKIDLFCFPQKLLISILISSRVKFHVNLFEKSFFFSFFFSSLLAQNVNRKSIESICFYFIILSWDFTTHTHEHTHLVRITTRISHRICFSFIFYSIQPRLMWCEFVFLDNYYLEFLRFFRF